jgi:WD40 repeat protein
MNFPSSEFDTTLAALCHGTANDTEIKELHSVLRDNESARDAYLWHVELHSRLATMARNPRSIADILPKKNSKSVTARASFLNRMSASKWLAATVILFVFVGGTMWQMRHYEHTNTVNTFASTPKDVANSDPLDLNTTGNPSLSGIYKDTVHFEFAFNAPIIVGTGQKEPLNLGAHVPYSQSGNTLHLWDWSKSPVSRVLADTRLWPHDVFAVSPDGHSLVWANGTILDLASGTRSTIDLGGEYYLGNAGGQMQRIQQLRFTPDGRRLAIQLLSIVLTESSHPLRKQEFDTAAVTQIVEFPSGQMVGEFPSGLSLAFTQDGQRAIISRPMREPKQQIVELDPQTGNDIRTFQPRLKGFAYAMCLSTSDKLLAVFDSEGEVLVWDTVTGSLKHRVPVQGDSATAIRIAPNERWLAVSAREKLFVIDLTTSTIVATISQFVGSSIIYWSTDSQIITSVQRPHLEEKRDPVGLYNVLPLVKHIKIGDDIRK